MASLDDKELVQVVVSALDSANADMPFRVGGTGPHSSNGTS